MTDETYTLIQTQKERGSMRSRARARKCGSKSKRCTLPSDNLTPAQRRKLDGPCETVNLNRPMTYEELTALSPTLQFLYLDNCINKYKARRTDLVKMLGCAQGTFTRLLPTLPGKLIFHGKPKQPAPEWLAFIKDTASVPDPADDPRAVAATTPAPDPDIKQDPNPPQPVTILSGSFTLHGTAADLLAALARMIDTGEALTYTLSFTK